MQNIITRITYINGMHWGFFDKHKKAVVFFDYDKLKIVVGDGVFVFKKGGFFVSANYKSNLVILNGEGFYVNHFRNLNSDEPVLIKNLKFVMPSLHFQEEFFEELKKIAHVQDFG